ncbi:MAG: NHL repeat-containing protein [Panacagrimonas sp.]
MPSNLLPNLSRFFRILLLLPVLNLGACGGGGGDAGTDIDMPEAFGLVGQADLFSGRANRGSTVAGDGIAQPLGGIATDGEKFYLADYGNNRVLGWNSIPANSAVPADFILGQSNSTSSAPGTAANRFALPASVAISGNKLVLADAGNNRVLIWNSLPTSNEAADVVLGQTDFTANDPLSSATGLSFPAAVMIANNQLFVADQNNNRVLIWQDVPTASGTAADVVLGQRAFDTSAAGDEEDGLNNPAGLWTDGFRLLVGDSGNNRVMYWAQVPRVSGADATYVIGQADFARTTAGVGSASMRTPYGIASDGTRIYVADAGNNRVLEFDAFPIASGAVALDVYGQNTFEARTPNDDDQDGVADDDPSARTLSSPTGATYSGGVLYVSDRNNHRVLFLPD